MLEEYNAAGNRVRYTSTALFQICMSGPGQPAPAECISSAPPPGTFLLHGLAVEAIPDGPTLLYARARYYDTKHGRWLQRDPKGYVDGPNLYEAFGGNPLVNRDPSGEYYKLWSTWESGSDVYWQEVTATGWWLTGKPDQEMNLGKYYCDGSRKFVVYTGWAAASYERERPDLYIVPFDAVMEWAKGELSDSRYGREVYKHGIPMRWSGDGKLEVMPRSEGEQGRQDLMGMMDQADRRWAEFANWASTPFGTRTLEMILSGGVDPLTERNMSGKELRAHLVRVGMTGASLYAGASLMYGQAASGTLGASQSNWITRFPGVQIRRYGNYWVKRVNPNSFPLMQKWGQYTINLQNKGLAALRVAGERTADFRLFRSGRLVTSDVGPPLSRWNYLNLNYWSAYARHRRTIGFFNDLRPGNYGPGFVPFDPAIDPIQKALGIGGGLGFGGGMSAIGWWVLDSAESE